MRIVCISDTHRRHHGVEVPDGDVLIHAGDFSNGGTLDECFDFGLWLRSLPHAHKILVAGNHDYTLDRHRNGDIETRLRCQLAAQGGLNTDSDVTYLEGSGAFLDFGEDKAHPLVLGFPYTPLFGWHAGFMYERGTYEWEKYHLTPTSQCDILVTHGPPFEILDLTDGVRAGCERLRAALAGMEKKPKLHVFGHIHEGYGYVEKDGILHVNAALWDFTKGGMRRPIVVDLDDYDLSVQGVR